VLELWVLGDKLTWNRGTEVDKGQPETQSPGFLDDRGDDYMRRKCILSIIIPFASDAAQIGGIINTFKLRCQCSKWHPFMHQHAHLNALNL
jgi:hypothetical protein